MPPKRKQKKQNINPLILILGGAALLLAAIIWGLSGAPGNNPSAQNAPGEDIPYPEIERVSLENAQTAYANASAVIVDVRDASSYTASHIPGALSIPLAELENRLNELEPDQWIITYCT